MSMYHLTRFLTKMASLHLWTSDCISKNTIVDKYIYIMTQKL